MWEQMGVGVGAVDWGLRGELGVGAVNCGGGGGGGGGRGGGSVLGGGGGG